MQIPEWVTTSIFGTALAVILAWVAKLNRMCNGVAQHASVDAMWKNTMESRIVSAEKHIEECSKDNGMTRERLASIESALNSFRGEFDRATKQLVGHLLEIKRNGNGGK